jgi:exonuclease SbcD
MKIIFTGDWHIRGNNPRYRTDNYREALKAKLQEIFQLAEEHGAWAIVTPGDTFDRPEVSIAVLLEFAELLSTSPVQILTTIGNHDVYGYNLETYQRTSLKLMELLVRQFRVLRSTTDAILLPPAKLNQLTFSPYSSQMDKDGYGYSPECDWGGLIKIVVAHGMMLDHRPPFDRYTLLEEAKTTAQLVLTGHCHIGYGIYRRSDGVTFVNPGALTRIAASVSEIERPIRVALIEINKDETIDVQLIPLKSAKPGTEVLDRSEIEEENQRQYAMDEFSALIQSNTGEKILLNINDIIETIAAQEKIDEQVVARALAEIATQRANCGE